MHATHELRYDAPPDRVYAMLADPAFRERVCEALDVLRHEVSISPAGNGMQVVVDQTQPATGIPSFAQRFVGDEIRIIQAETWTSPAGADLDVTIPGKPGHMHGSITLAADGEGSVQTVDVEITVSIPFVGGKLEGLVGGLFESALRKENRVGREYLSA